MKSRKIPAVPVPTPDPWRPSPPGPWGHGGSYYGCQALGKWKVGRSLIDSNEIEDHKYLHRSEALRAAVESVVSQGWTSWSEILEVTRAEQFSDKTVTNAVREGVDFGLFRKRGGRFDVHHKGEAEVAMTPLGYQLWLVDFEPQRLQRQLDAGPTLCEHGDVPDVCDEEPCVSIRGVVAVDLEGGGG